ncbi:hypothetical protein MJT46_000674 [Ovis ammon polii x Ovis aries]|nr:hypothetical protein MJT46_000674 [Ovis ammon polii x Ovis aries]
MKGKGEKERYTHLNAEFQRIARRDKKAFLSDQCKEIEENNRMGKTRALFKKIRDTMGTFHPKKSTIKGRNEYIMKNAGLEEAQAGVKIARRNINNLRYADDTTLMAESEEELKSLLMKVKEESEKVGLKLNIQKTKIMASGPITSWEIDGETVETVSDFILGGSKITADGKIHPPPFVVIVLLKYIHWSIKTEKMKNEIAAVVFFFTRLVRKHDKLKKEAVERFAEKLTLILQEKYKNHWYPEKPSKGQAYRCIRVNKFQRVDPDVLKACENSCILYSDLGLPKELTLWVDPCEVCCRYGEKNNAFIVASFENEDENKDEISKKVTRALDKVTSDYHSGSSSSDEETCKEVEVKPNSVAATPSPVYQISELIFPPLPMWHPLPRKKPIMYRGNGNQSHYPPPIPFGYPNQGRKNKPYRPIPVTWVPPPGMHCDRNHWINPHMLAPH